MNLPVLADVNTSSSPPGLSSLRTSHRTKVRDELSERSDGKADAVYFCGHKNSERSKNRNWSEIA
jgi:hypothetical protein